MDWFYVLKLTGYTEKPYSYSVIRKVCASYINMDTKSKQEEIIQLEAEINDYYSGLELFADVDTMDSDDGSVNSTVCQIQGQSTPIPGLGKGQKTLYDMFRKDSVDKTKKRKKRKFISPVNQNPTQAQSNDTSQESLEEDTDINKAMESMREAFSENLKSVTDNMTASFTQQFANFTVEIKGIIEANKRAGALERQKLAGELEELRTTVKKQATEIEDLKKDMAALTNGQKLNEGCLFKAEKDISDLKEDCLQMEARSMRSNLIFYNIAERGSETYQVTESIVRAFLQEQLKIPKPELDQIQIDRAHRMGQKGRKPRPIVVRFLNTWSKSIVFRYIKNLNKSDKYAITDQLPPELQERRKRLMPKFIEAKKQSQKPKWSSDKLIVKDEVFRIEKDSVKDSRIDIRTTSTSKKVVRAPPKQYGGSSFQGHSVCVSSQDEIVPALHAIYSDSIGRPGQPTTFTRTVSKQVSTCVNTMRTTRNGEPVEQSWIF